MANIFDFNEPRNERSKIFLDDKAALQYMRERGLLPDHIICERCSGVMKIEKNARSYAKYSYKCVERRCRFTMNLFRNTLMRSPKIRIKDYLFSIYKWIENSFEKDVTRNADISRNAFRKIKNNINFFLEEEYNEQRILGGPGVSVQVDETAICHGFLIDSPSVLEDEFAGITWLVGLIESDTGHIKYEIVQNRREETFRELFRRNLRPQTTVITDGHKSYPGAVREISGYHIVVNHSTGFTNQEGFHTNNIENLWSILKYEIKKRRGVIKANLNSFLKEFDFRFKNLRKKTEGEIKEAFENILSFINERNN